MKLKQLNELDVNSIAADDCILFMWTTGPQMANSIELGEAWGFEYKTVAFVWDKMVHNPGRYTLSQTEFVLAFKKGKFPQPRGARNVRQMVTIHRGAHSVKPVDVIEGDNKKCSQSKIKLNYLHVITMLDGIIGDWRIPNVKLKLKLLVKWIEKCVARRIQMGTAGFKV